MNKFAAIALLACVATLVRAQAEGEVEVENPAEVGLLMGHENLFAPYCLKARSYVIDDLRARANDKSSFIFSTFFGATSEIADEVLNVEKRAVEELAKQVAEPDTPVSEEPLPEDKIQALIEEGKREIKNRSPLGRIAAASYSAASVLVNVANSALFIRLGKARAQMNANQLLRGVLNTCNQVAEYEHELESRLESAKAELGDSAEPEVQQFIAKVSVQSLNCHTTKTVTRIHAFCDLFKNASGAFLKMLGMNGAKFQAQLEQLKE